MVLASIVFSFLQLAAAWVWLLGYKHNHSVDITLDIQNMYLLLGQLFLSFTHSPSALKNQR